MTRFTGTTAGRTTTKDMELYWQADIIPLPVTRQPAANRMIPIAMCLLGWRKTVKHIGSIYKDHLSAAYDLEDRRIQL